MEEIILFPLKELKAINNIIKNLVLQENGIIFGTFVSNNIISEYYKKLYYKENKGDTSLNNNIKYWDNSFHKETEMRLLSNDLIKIFFTKHLSASMFLSKVKLLFKLTKMEVKNKNDLTNNYCKKKININIKYGELLSFDGYNLNLNIHIYIPNIENFTLEPPFNKCGLLCYIFIQDKYGVRISNNTGSEIDLLSLEEKKGIESKMKELLVNNETYVIKSLKLYTNNKIAKFIINKLMYYSNLNWYIKNIPLKIIDYNYNYSGKCCNICKNKYNNNDKIVLILRKVHDKFNNIIMEYEESCYHQKCFYTYVYNIIKNNKKIITPITKYPINFVNTYLDITKMI